MNWATELWNSIRPNANTFLRIAYARDYDADFVAIHMFENAGKRIQWQLSINISAQIH